VGSVKGEDVRDIISIGGGLATWFGLAWWMWAIGVAFPIGMALGLFPGIGVLWFLENVAS
jgi:hypothetical protein